LGFERRDRLCGRGSGLGYGEWDAAEFGGVGEFVEGFEAEVLEEVFGALVEEGAAGDIGASGDADEAAFEEHIDHAIDGDAADGFDIGACDGLAVGDDGQCFEGGAAEADGFALGEKLADPGGAVGGCDEMPAVDLLDELERARGVVEVEFDFLEEGADFGFLGFGEGFEGGVVGIIGG
jgi:hypothetical protein